jgi:hypothetical protein
VKHAFLQQQDWDMFVQETNSPSFQQLRRWNKREHCIISHTRWEEKVIMVTSCRRKTEPLGPIS